MVGKFFNLQNRYDEVLAYLAGPQATAAAVAISKSKPKDHLTAARPRRYIPYTGPGAEELLRAGEKLFKDVLYAAKTAKKEGR
jgi:hypothetical protein